MTDSSDLRLDVLDLLRHPGSRRDVRVDAEVPDLAVGMVRVPAGVRVRADLALEALSDGVVAHGHASVRWVADCARCLDEIDGTTEVAVDELFEARPVEGETYPLDGARVDLEPMLRDVLGVEFPLAPAPPLDDSGRCTVCRRTRAELGVGAGEQAGDPRWDALRALDL